MRKVVVISMSGGLDSATLVARALNEGFTVVPINFVYGQKHSIERVFQRKLFEHYRKEFGARIEDVISIDLTQFNRSMTDIYKSLRDQGKIGETTQLEFYVPSRNLLFSSISAQIAETYAIANNLDSIMIGLGIHRHTEYRNYWDITPDFAERLQNLLYLNDAVEIALYVPYVDSTKTDIIKDAVKYNVPYYKTWTCYDPKATPIGNDLYRIEPCKICEACVEREKGGKEAGIEDINDYYEELTGEELKLYFEGENVP